MHIISMFDGMAVGYAALIRSGHRVHSYTAAEVDRYAIQVATNNWPGIKHVGSVESLRLVNGQRVDLLIGGSPCQGFSYAGKKLNFEDPRSRLFFEYVRVLKQAKKINPSVLFLLENVQMVKESQNIISEFLGVQPIIINSALVSAQHRKRFYWTNIPTVSMPKDKGITLNNVLLSNVAEKYFLSDTAVNRLDAINLRAKARGLGYKDCILEGTDKFLNLDANFFKGPDGKRGVIRHRDGRLRMPSPVECERLQTLPDNYTAGVSDTQRYKMLGNGWTCDVLAHIFKHI